MMRFAIGASLVLLALFAVFIKSGEVLSVRDRKQELLVISPFNEQTFYTSVGRHRPDAFPATARGAIVPHHALAGEVIAGVLSRFAHQPVRTVFLIGPNHKEDGWSTLVTADCDWQFADRRIAADTDALADLEGKKLVRVRNEIVAGDQSISTVLPYISYYFPEVIVVPLLVSGRTDVEELSRITEALGASIDEDTVVIAAVDFSHGRDAETAMKNDLYTKTVMDQRDWRPLLKMGNEHTDGAATLSLFLRLMDAKAAGGVQELFHTDSSSITQRKSNTVTSYIGRLYHE